MDKIVLNENIIAKILSFTDLDTINNFREIDKKFIDNNINYIYNLMIKTHPFLKYKKLNNINFDDFINVWNMGNFKSLFDPDIMKIIKRYDIFKKNVLYKLVLCDIFNEINDESIGGYISKVSIINNIFITKYDNISYKDLFKDNRKLNKDIKKIE